MRASFAERRHRLIADLGTPDSAVLALRGEQVADFGQQLLLGRRGLLRDAQARLAPVVEVVERHDDEEVHRGGDDQDDDENPPAAWTGFRERIEAADAVLFVTPEHNRSVPAALKNAIDVGSRPYGKSSFLGKPIGIVSNSPGPLGGVSAAKHLQNILPGISGPILGQPETYLTNIGDAFDDKGQLTKEALQIVLRQYIDAFAAFIEKQNR